MEKLFKLLMVVLLLGATQAGAKEIEGVDLPEQINLDGSDSQLVLNGAGIRSKFIFQVYIGALYLTGKQSDAEKVLADDGPKRVAMHFLYDKVAKNDLTDAWWDGFKDNATENEMTLLSERITAFAELFADAHKGDVIWIDYLPNRGTQVSINGAVAGNIPGADFNRALLKIWIGSEPVTTRLKKGMLGIE